MNPVTPEGGTQTGTSADVHPLMEPEKMKGIWHTAQKEWIARDDMVCEVESDRDAWDQRIP